MDISIGTYDDYTPAIKSIIGAYAPMPGMMDSSGKDRDDYFQELQLVSWTSQRKFRDRYGYCSPAERRYTHKCLWNYARSYRRDANSLDGRHVDYEVIAPTLDTGIQLEDQVGARISLSTLESRLPRRDWDTLLSVGVCNGSVMEAAGQEQEQYTRFRKRVYRVRRQAKALLAA